MHLAAFHFSKAYFPRSLLSKKKTECFAPYMNFWLEIMTSCCLLCIVIVTDGG